VPPPAVAGGKARVAAVLDLVVPVLNEEARIGATLVALAAVAKGQDRAVRLVIVDNGCVDTTTSVVDSLPLEGVTVQVMSCKSRGKGAAVRTAVMGSSAPFVGFCDSDLSVPAHNLVTALDLLDAGWDMVVGSRRCPGARYVVPQSLGRKLGGALIRFVSRDLRGPVSDTQCGFKFFTRDTARRLFDETAVDGFAFDIEIVARALRSGVRLVEMPVSWTDEPGSTFRPLAHGFQALSDIRSARRSVKLWAAKNGEAA
jgi:glycosyltransferase involved in cell wall biosynthesis